MGTINSLLCHRSLICFCCQSFLSLLKLMFTPLQDSSSSMKDLSETSILLNIELDIVPWQFPITHFTSSFTPPPQCFHSCPRHWRAWFNDALGFGSKPKQPSSWERYAHIRQRWKSCLGRCWWPPCLANQHCQQRCSWLEIAFQR